MLVEIISKYLQSNKRLVVPNLGAFIVKTTENKILFSNLMKGDDGVLRRLLVENGIKELEAAGLIDRFVFEINYRLQNEGECAIGGLGRLVAKSNGAVAFEYNPSVSGANLEGDMPARKAAEKAAAQPEAKPAIEPNKQETEPESESPESVSEISPAEEPSKPRRTAAADVYGDNTEASRRVRPEKYTKGLRYGKGAKVVTGRESATARRSKNGDVIIKIAILVALLAIAVLLYGLYNDWRAGKLFSDDVPVIDNSEIYEEVPQSAEEGIRNPDLDYLTPKN
jgi:nucleoid DNA-binding protein